MFNLQQAASKAGVSAGLLHLWIATGKFAPAFNMTVNADSVQDSVARKALKQTSWTDREDCSNWVFSEADVAQLRKMVEQTAEKKSKIETSHVKGTHYTVQELAALWGLGVDKIRELFSNEPGVIKIQRPSKRGRRVYSTLRIPENVAERVQRRTANA